MPPAKVWEKTDAVMTSAATKNLSIEKSVVNALGSDHIPHHLLWKSHAVEALDRSNLKVLKQTENSVSQRETERINPTLKWFFRGKKTTVEAGIKALLNLVTHDKNGRFCSLADHFSNICQRAVVIKIIFLYQQC